MRIKRALLVLSVGVALTLGLTLGNPPLSQEVVHRAYLCFSAFYDPSELERWARLCALARMGDAKAGQELAQLVEQTELDVILSPPGETFSAWFVILHNDDLLQSLPLSLLINGIQTPILIEGRQELVHRLAVPKDEGELQPYLSRFEVPSLPEGLSTATLILLDPIINFFTRDRKGTLIVPVTRSIYRGEGEAPRQSAARPPESAFRQGGIFRSDEETRLPDEGVYLSLHSNPGEEEVEGWKVRVKPGERLEYFLILRAECVDQETHDYLVTVLLDGMQVPVNAQDQDPRVFLRLACGEEVELPASLIAPQQPGEYRLLPFAIMNPFHAYTEETRLTRDAPLVLTTYVYDYVVEVAAGSD